MQELINRVNSAIAKAVTGQTKLTKTELTAEGMSSEKVRILLNELVKSDTKYLEIGVWKGSTFISAMRGNTPKSAVAIDNFSQFNGNMEIFNAACAASNVKDFTILDEDCFNLLPESKQSIKDVDVYFYDGDHRAEDQRQAITYYMENLANKFILIVDDYNWQSVVVGTKKGLEENNITVHADWSLPAYVEGDPQNWWNGLYVAVCEKA